MSRSRDLASDALSSRPKSGRDALVAKFTKVLPGWLRRSGVHRADLGDAVQEALVAVLLKFRDCPDDVSMDEAATRDDLMRIVSNVALRLRRQAQREKDRFTSIDGGVSEVRDEEAWVETRVVLLGALENLDEPARALIYAHEIEGRTNVEIAATLKLKEDAVEKRVSGAKQRLRVEIEQLEQGRIRKHRAACLLLLGLGFDPLDRALFGAVYESVGNIPKLAELSKLGPLRQLRQMRQLRKLRQIGPFLRPNLPTTALVGALTLTPSSSSSSSTDVWAARTNVSQEQHVSSISDSNTVSSTYSFSTIFFVPVASTNAVRAEGSGSTSATSSGVTDSKRGSMAGKSTRSTGSNHSRDLSGSSGSSGSQQASPTRFADIPSLYVP